MGGEHPRNIIELWRNREIVMAKGGLFGKIALVADVAQAFVFA